MEIKAINCLRDALEYCSTNNIDDEYRFIGRFSAEDFDPKRYDSETFCDYYPISFETSREVRKLILLTSPYSDEIFINFKGDIWQLSNYYYEYASGVFEDYGFTLKKVIPKNLEDIEKAENGSKKWAKFFVSAKSQWYLSF